MKKNAELIFVLLLLFIGLSFTLYKNITLSREFHLSLQASSWLAGRMDIVEGSEKYIDTELRPDGKYYFNREPLPVLLMVPFVLLFGSRAPQGYLAFIITVINIFLINRILFVWPATKRLNIRIWFILIFLFASNIVSVIFSPNSWYLIQNLGVTLMLMGIIEWRGRKRWWFLFLLIILISLVKRNMVFPLAIYFFIDSFFLKENLLKKTLRGIYIVLAIIIGTALFYGYISLGMHSALGQEFSKDSNSGYMIDHALLMKMNNKGMWNLSNIPTNFVKFFLLGPEIAKENSDANANLTYPYIYPKQDGMSFFLISPIFLSLLFLPLQKKKVWLPVLGAIAVWAAIYLTYFASGSAQFGARYTAEIVPFLFLILMEVLPPYFGGRAKAIVSLSVFFNIFLFMMMNAMGALMR